MPGVHNAKKFKLVGCWVNLDFLKEIDEARGETGRSQFVRDALQEKLETKGVMVLREKVIAPDRAGKGGPVSYRKKPSGGRSDKRDISSAAVADLRNLR